MRARARASGRWRQAGRDKLTFVADPEIAALRRVGWSSSSPRAPASTASGIVPVDLEPLGAVEAYGPDRVFVRLDAGRSGRPPRPDGGSADALLAEPRGGRPPGHPDRRSTDPIDLGGEFVRWEVATAIAGVVLGIDPFDQPNVEEAKELTRELLERPTRGTDAADGRSRAGPTAPIAVGRTAWRSSATPPCG